MTFINFHLKHWFVIKLVVESWLWVIWNKYICLGHRIQYIQYKIQDRDRMPDKNTWRQLKFPGILQIVDGSKSENKAVVYVTGCRWRWSWSYFVLDRTWSRSTSFIFQRVGRPGRCINYRKRLCDIHSNDLAKDSLSAYDAFLLDDSRDHVNPTIYVWLRRRASQNERQIPPQHA